MKFDDTLSSTRLLIRVSPSGSDERLLHWRSSTLSDFLTEGENAGSSFSELRERSSALSCPKVEKNDLGSSANLFSPK